MEQRSERRGIREPIEPGCVLEYGVGASPAALERARAYLADPEGCACAEPRRAATVMLLADGRVRTDSAAGTDAEPVDVFMMKRASTMAFVPDAVVFPGGGVDERDVECPLACEGPSFDEWARRMGCEPQIAKGVVVAAARELFEESGVLLAASGAGELHWDEPGDHWARERECVASRAVSFGEFLAERGFALRSDLLSLRSHWVTPPCEPRRYDTYFFTARLPHGQHADGCTSEAVAAGWLSPGEAFRRFDAGRLLLVPPTISNLAALAGASSVAEAMDAPFCGHVFPVPALAEDGAVVYRCTVR